MQAKDFQTTKKCVWGRVWDEYINGEITAEELERQTGSRQESIQFKAPEHINSVLSGAIKSAMEGK